MVNRIFAPDAEETAFARKVITRSPRQKASAPHRSWWTAYLWTTRSSTRLERIVALADVIAAREIGRSRTAAGATK